MNSSCSPTQGLALEPSQICLATQKEEEAACSKDSSMQFFPYNDGM